MFESDSTALNWREYEAAGQQRGNHRCFFTALTWWNPWGVHCTSFSTSFSWNWTNKYKNPAAQHGGWWDTAAWGPRCSSVRPSVLSCTFLNASLKLTEQTLFEVCAWRWFVKYRSLPGPPAPTKLYTHAYVRVDVNWPWPWEWLAWHEPVRLELWTLKHRTK